jgi:tripartite-type tricarboxylate transporter receptor subunit TctC
MTVPQHLLQETTMQRSTSSLARRLGRRSALTAVAVGLGLMAWQAPALAQGAWPNKPIRVVVPFPAGSSPDVIGRFWGERLQRELGQTVVFDNRPGAASIIGAQAVATAPADGYTLLYTVGNTTSLNPHVYTSLPYKVEDFAPVIRVLSVPYVMMVSANSPYRTAADVAAAAKANPGGVLFASYGVGSTPQAVMARFANTAGVKMTHVPYKDGGLTDMAAGLVHTSFEPATTAIPQLKGSRLRGVAVTSAKRLDSLPDVPTLSETYPGLVADSWHGLMAPRGTPPEVVNRLAAAMNRIIQTEEFRSRTQELGLQPAGGSPAEFQRFMVEDAKVWAKVAKDNEIKVE